MSTNNKTAVIVKSPFAKINALVRSYRSGMLENKIVELRRIDSKLQWDLGDMAMEIIAAGAIHGETIAQFEAAAYISWRLRGSHSERQPKTIQDYIPVCVFFPSAEQAEQYKRKTKKDLERAGIREMYSALPFSHFALAQRSGERWKKVLDYSVTLADKNQGEPVSVRKIEEKFFPQNNGNAGQTSYGQEPPEFDDSHIMDGNPEAGTVDLNSVDEAVAMKSMKKMFGIVLDKVSRKYPDLSEDAKVILDMMDDLINKIG